MNEQTNHNCAVCNTDISDRRVDAITCSDKCRARLSRKRKQHSVLVRLRLPITTYTHVVASAFSAGQTVHDYLMNQMTNSNGEHQNVHDRI